MYKLCSHSEKTERPVVFSNGTKHIAQECSVCGRHIKYVSNKTAADIVIYFGKYKGKKLQDIARTDREYAEWLLREEVLKSWQAGALREILNG